jgi:uncharacterized protein (DUF1800 family)
MELDGSIPERLVPVRAAPGMRTIRGFALLSAAFFALAGATHRGVVPNPVPPLMGRSDPNDVIRFLEQATFGPTRELARYVQSAGIEKYLDEQLQTAGSFYQALPQMPADSTVGCPVGSAATCFRDNYTMYPMQVKFFQNALGQDDQVRQRVALSLHEVLVVSGIKLRQPSQMAPYLNMLLENAFSNYRKTLEDLTLSPAMGYYLDMVNNDAPVAGGSAAPNENYAREVLQLFSVGLDTLNQDGTPQRDSSGNSIPTYNQATVTQFAKVFTGWTYAPYPGVAGQKHNPANFLAPMRLYRNAAGVDANHDKTQKNLLVYSGAVYSTLGPNQDGFVDLSEALDNIFFHPNVGPFIGKQLIQHLVTSNPSPAYVSRVSAAFANNGSGTRGDMAAVVRAVLLDPEARGPSKTDAAYGRLREPVLLITNLCRALDATSDGILGVTATALGQNLFNSTTVFGYYPHVFEIPGTQVQGPEFGTQTNVAAQARANLVNTLAFSQIRSVAPDFGTYLDLRGLQSLAADPVLLVGELNGLLMHGSMSDQMKKTVTDAVSAIPATNPLLRAQTAIYLMATSSQYQITR